MIQRIQTLYLIMAGIVSAICGLAVHFCWNIPPYNLVALDEPLHTGLTCMSSIILLLGSLRAILYYKHRQAQMQVCLGIGVLAMVSAVLYCWFALVVPFAYLAWRGIRADEKLIRSIDRIR